MTVHVANRVERAKMRHILRFSLILAVLVAFGTGLSSCGSNVQFVRLDDTVYPPKDPDAAIEVYKASVATPHVVIGTLTTQKKIEATGKSSYDLALESLEDYARQVGADALVELKTDTVDEPSPRIVLTATAVRYLEQAGTVRSQ
jgi:uncharacterized protein YbjQ (UPF0145 family)